MTFSVKIQTVSLSWKHRRSNNQTPIVFKKILGHAPKWNSQAVVSQNQNYSTLKLLIWMEEFVLREPDKDVNWDRSSTAISRKVTRRNRTNMAVWILSSSGKCLNYITLLLVKYEALLQCHKQCGNKRRFQQTLEVFPIFIAQSQMTWALRRCHIR